MGDAVLPTDEEIASLVPGPDSILWRYGCDARAMFTAGTALILQVSHPTVAAGVREHSDYAADPWGRLLRTMDNVNLMVYGGAETAAETGRRLREQHKRIRGADLDGRRYHALEPEAFAWVHATLIREIVDGHRRFARQFSRDQIDLLYAEWLALGRLMGVREGDLPDDWDGFLDYFDSMVEERLGDNDVVHGVLATLGKPTAPSIPVLLDPAWRLARMPLGRLLSLATVGLLPATLRDRCGLSWTRAQQFELNAFAAASRAATPLIPGSVRRFGLPYLRWRGLEPPRLNEKARPRS